MLSLHIRNALINSMVPKNKNHITRLNKIMMLGPVLRELCLHALVGTLRLNFRKLCCSYIINDQLISDNVLSYTCTGYLLSNPAVILDFCFQVE